MGVCGCVCEGVWLCLWCLPEHQEELSGESGGSGSTPLTLSLLPGWTSVATALQLRTLLPVENVF